MGSKKPHQRKNAKVNRKVSRVAKNRLNISFSAAHPLVAANWDKSQTLKENYKRLGLASHLNGHAGGQVLSLQSSSGVVVDTVLENESQVLGVDDVEWKTIDQIDAEKESQLKSNFDANNGLFAPLETDLDIDERITSIGSKVSLKKLVSTVGETTSLATQIIEEMKQQSLNVRPSLRFQSEQETLVFEALMERYGLDYAKMARDSRLNKYQLSEGQLKKKFARFVAANAAHVKTMIQV